MMPESFNHVLCSLSRKLEGPFFSNLQLETNSQVFTSCLAVEVLGFLANTAIERLLDCAEIHSRSKYEAKQGVFFLGEFRWVLGDFV